MYALLVRLMLLAALLELGIGMDGLTKLRDVLKVDWKPISVFPEEAKRFKGY